MMTTTLSTGSSTLCALPPEPPIALRDLAGGAGGAGARCGATWSGLAAVCVVSTTVAASIGTGIGTILCLLCLLLVMRG